MFRMRSLFRERQIAFLFSWKFSHDDYAFSSRSLSRIFFHSTELDFLRARPVFIFGKGFGFLLRHVRRTRQAFRVWKSPKRRRRLAVGSCSSVKYTSRMNSAINQTGNRNRKLQHGTGPHNTLFRGHPPRASSILELRPSSSKMSALRIAPLWIVPLGRFREKADRRWRNRVDSRAKTASQYWRFATLPVRGRQTFVSDWLLVK